MLAVKVTLVPAQIVVPGLALMVIVGVTTGFTVMAMGLLTAVTGEGQVRLLPMSQVTTCPFVRPVVVNVEVVMPVEAPLMRHR